MQTTVDAYVLELECVGLILGVIWPETLVMEWKNDNLVKLVGQSFEEKIATFQSIMSAS